MALVAYYLKIDGIDGESYSAKHKSEMDILSWSWSEKNAGDFRERGGGGAGKVAMQDFHFTMVSNKATPKLMQACACGEHIKKAILTVSEAGGKMQDYLKVTLSDLLVSEYEFGGGGADVKPLDRFGLNFSKIEIEYHEQMPNGNLGGAIKGGYDVKANKIV